MSATYHSTHPQADAEGRSPDAPLWSGDLRDLSLDDVIKRQCALLQTIGRLFVQPIVDGGFVSHRPNQYEMQAAHRYAGLAADCLNEMERRR